MPLLQTNNAIQRGELIWPESRGSKRWGCIQTMGLEDHRARGSQQVARGSLPTSSLSPPHSVPTPRPAQGCSWAR